MTKPLPIFFQGIILFFGVLLITIQTKAQQFKLMQGVAITEYRYINDQGQSVSGLKSGSGLTSALAFHKSNLVDTIKLKLDQTPFAIYLNQNPKVATILSLINYDLGLQFNQLNAVGNIQNNAFSYQTNFIGLHGKLGIIIPLPYKILSKPSRDCQCQ